MQIAVNRQSGVPLVKQIFSELADRIRSGLMEEGTRLPSIRDLSQQLNVSFMTVVQVYQKLEQEGLVTRVHGKGTFVRVEKPQDARTRDGERAPDPRWQLAVTDYLPRAQFWRQLQLVEPGEGFVFSVTSLDPDLLPQKEWGKVIQQIINDDPEILTKYGPVQGDGAFRTAFAAYAKQFGLSLNPEEMIVTNGAQQAIDQVARSFIGPGDVVAVEAPTYSAAIDVFRSRGATILSVPVDEEGMRVDDLATLADKHPPKLIYTMPTYQNPTGAVMSVSRRIRLLELAQSYRSLILEDDPWSELSFAGPPLPAIRSMDDHGHVIYVKSFSKVLAPSCRVAVLSASGTILGRLTAAKAISDLGSPVMTQRAILSFIRSADMDKHIKQLQKDLLKRRDLALTLLNQHAPEGVSWTKPEGGCNIWITLPTWINTDELLIAANRQGLYYMPGSVCYPGEPEYNHLRISFSAMPEDKLKEGMLNLTELFAEALQTKPNLYKSPVM